MDRQRHVHDEAKCTNKWVSACNPDMSGMRTSGGQFKDSGGPGKP